MLKILGIIFYLYKFADKKIYKQHVMHKITKHPILDIPSVKKEDKVTFLYNGKKIRGEKGKTIAAALHQAGYPIHSHSLKNRERGLECGIGKCGACEMLVDGEIKRICITSVDNVKEVKEIPHDYKPCVSKYIKKNPVKVYKTTVAIIGAGPSGLSCREELNKHSIENIVIDNNSKIGGQFNMQTHQFFFFEKEKRFGGMRGFDIAKILAGNNLDGIFLNSSVWDILEDNRIAVKNIKTQEIYYVESDYLVIATGAIPFMPAFENDDLPGVYTAAVIQKMMNIEFTLLGKNILTVGAGNIGYLTSYQLMQAGANVKAIIEAMPYEGGFPVQANRIRRLAIPVLLSKTLIKAIPNKDHTAVTGAVIADCKNFKPIPGTEKIIDGIDAINICTGLIPDDSLFIKGKEIFGRKCFGAGDAIRIGEGTSAVLRGRQVAYEIFQEMEKYFNYENFLSLSKEYIDSQQEPVKILSKSLLPSTKRMEKPFAVIDCAYGFACNPCVFACQYGAITKPSPNSVPVIDYAKCIGCMQCVTQCPGLAIFGFNLKKDWLFCPVEYEVKENLDCFIVDNNGEKLGKGIVEKIQKKDNKTNLVRVKSLDIHGKDLLKARGFLLKEKYPEPLDFKPVKKIPSEEYICHCEDVTLNEILKVIGDRKFISIDEIKHNTRLGMGHCRGTRCFKRLKQTLGGAGIVVTDQVTPRGPMSNQIGMGELYPSNLHEKFIATKKQKPPKIIKVQSLVAGGGIGGSSVFRYLAEEGMSPVLINYGRGSSWRNIAGARPAFSIPELADISIHNYEIFENLQKISNINLGKIDYITFAHDKKTYDDLEKSKQWSDAYMIEPKDFQKNISPDFNPNLKTYISALITKNCWQATPGMVVDLIRNIGKKNNGKILEDCKLIDLEKTDNIYKILVQNHEKEYIEYHTEIFVNALGFEANKFCKKTGLNLGIYPVKHQAFITQRLPFLGQNNRALDMLIDRRIYKGFSAVYGQQLQETGQIIGCASPATDPLQADKNIKINDKDFLEIVSETFINWIPKLSSVAFQAIWAGYYVEPKMIIDPEQGLFIGLKGQGFMLGQYLAKLYVDKLTGKKVPDYMDNLKITGKGLEEKSFA